jgi:hypothetical protein
MTLGARRLHIRIKSLLLLFLRKEESSFLKERSKELLLLSFALPATPRLP